MSTQIKEFQTFQDILYGWIKVSGSWSYASATTINVPSGATSIYQKGDKIRIKQGGSYKYFTIVTVATSLLTVTGGTDYTVANAGITDMYYSKSASPIGFPDFFNYTPIWDANSGVNPAIGNGTLTGMFRVEGTICHVRIHMLFGSTSTYGSGGAVYRLSLPISPNSGVTEQFLPAWIGDSSPWKDYCAFMHCSSTWLEYDTGLYVYTTNPITFASGDFIRVDGSYII